MNARGAGVKIQPPMAMVPRNAAAISAANSGVQASSAASSEALASSNAGSTLGAGGTDSAAGTAAGAAEGPAAARSYGVLTVVPPAPGPRRWRRSVPRDLIVLLDTSGSMEGRKMAAAREALDRFLFDLLGPDDEIFNALNNRRPVD